MAVSKVGGVLFWGPCMEDPTFLDPYSVPLLFGNSHMHTRDMVSFIGAPVKSFGKPKGHGSYKRTVVRPILWISMSILHMAILAVAHMSHGVCLLASTTTALLSRPQEGITTKMRTLPQMGFNRGHNVSTAKTCSSVVWPRNLVENREPEPEICPQQSMSLTSKAMSFWASFVGTVELWVCFYCSA